MSLRGNLVEIVGDKYASDKAKDLEAYSKGFSLTPLGVANVVRPKSAQEVQRAIKFANNPVVPVSSNNPKGRVPRALPVGIYGSLSRGYHSQAGAASFLI